VNLTDAMAVPDDSRTTRWSYPHDVDGGEKLVQHLSLSGTPSLALLLPSLISGPDLGVCPTIGSLLLHSSN